MAESHHQGGVPKLNPKRSLCPAHCEFAHRRILRLQRTAGMTGRAAASKTTEECRLWAGRVGVVTLDIKGVMRTFAAAWTNGSDAQGGGFAKCRPQGVTGCQKRPEAAVG